MSTHLVESESVTDPAEPAFLRLSGITVRFGGIVALNDVSIQADAGLLQKVSDDC